MLAIGLRLLAVICLAIMFAAVKVAGQRGVHVVETLFYRQFLALPLILGWLWMGPGFTSVKTARISAHASRTLVGMIGMVLNFLSVRSEEHTSELQSLMRISYAVFCLKKNNHLRKLDYKIK